MTESPSQLMIQIFYIPQNASYALLLPVARASITNASLRDISKLIPTSAHSSVPLQAVTKPSRDRTHWKITNASTPKKSPMNASLKAVTNHSHPRPHSNIISLSTKLNQILSANFQVVTKHSWPITSSRSTWAQAGYTRSLLEVFLKPILSNLNTHQAESGKIQSQIS